MQMYQKLAIEAIGISFNQKSTLSIGKKKRRIYNPSLQNGFTAYDSKLIYILSSVIKLLRAYIKCTTNVRLTLPPLGYFNNRQ